MRDIFNKVIAVAKTRMEAGQRQKLAWHQNQISLVLSRPTGSMIYGVVSRDTAIDPDDGQETDEDYPERLIFLLLAEVTAAAEKIITLRLNPHDGRKNENGDLLSMYDKMDEELIKYDCSFSRASVAQESAGMGRAR